MSNATVDLYQLHAHRHVTFHQVYLALQQAFRKQNKSSLLQLAASLYQCALLMNKICLKCIYSLNQLRQEVLYSSNHTTTKKKRNPNQTTTHKRRPAKDGQEQRLSIDEIESKMRQISKNQLLEAPSQGDSKFQTPVRPSQVPNPLFSVAVPPLPQDAIQFENQSPVISTQSQMYGALGVWEPSLERYDSWLELTKKGIRRQGTTVRKGTVRTKDEKTKTKAKLRTDARIQISQGLGFTQDYQASLTKIKQAKTQAQNLLAYDRDVFRKGEDLLIGITELLIEAEKRQMDKRVEDLGSQPLDDYTYPLLFSDMHSPQDSQIRVIGASEENDPNVTTKLQALILQKMQGELMKQQAVSIESFCIAKGITKDARVELFYQLLHMDFQLFQQSSSNFSEILIIRPNTKNANA